MADSIQEWLISEGFTISSAEPGHFYKGNIQIPFDEIIGYSVGSFKTKAYRRGWVKPPDQGVGKLPPVT